MSGLSETEANVVTIEQILILIKEDPLILWPRSGAGHLVNLGEVRALQCAYAKPCLDASTILFAAFGDALHALYVRGSVAIGAAVRPFSDLDLIAVGSELPELAPEECEKIWSTHPYIESVDLALLEVEDLLTSPARRKFRSMLTVQSKLLAGVDIRGDLPNCRPDAFFALDQFEELEGECRWLDDILSGAIETPSFRGMNRTLNFWGRWAMRNVLRATQLIAMLDTGEYSSHLGTCTVLAMRRFPDFKNELAAAYWIERQGAPDPDAALKTLRQFGASIMPIWQLKTQAYVRNS